MSDEKGLAEKVSAEEYLTSHGFQKQQCGACLGTGEVHLSDPNELRPCFRCDGRGFTWKAPVMRQGIAQA